MTYIDAKREIVTFYLDKFDPWGSAMGILFDIADVLHWHRDTTPALYIAGIGEDIQADWLHELSTPDLLRLFHVLSRYTAILDKQGYSY